MKCVAYCRVSTDNSEQLTSLENQIKHYSELFKKNSFEGAECGMYYSKEGKKELISYIPSIFADEGISGTKLKNRGAFKYMLECAYRKEFDAILVKNVQRWARNVEDGAGILKKLKIMGIKVIFEDGWLDSSNPANEATINILFVMAQEESRAKSTAVQFGIRRAQQAGKFTSATPYGYYTKDGFMQPIPEQLETVKMIYDWYSKGWGGTKIAKELNLRNIPTQKNRRWAQTQIYDILKNQIYIGRQITHTVVNTDINLDKFVHTEGEIQTVYKSQKPVDEDNWIVTNNEALRIISDELFTAVQAELKKRKELFGQSNRPSSANIFSNLLYCRNCGKAMRRKKLWGWKKKDGTRKFDVEWVCATHDMFHNAECEHRNSWHEDALFQRVVSEIKRLRSNKSELDVMFDNYIKSFYTKEEVDSQINELQQSLADIKEQLSANLKLYTKNIIDDEQYKLQNDELQSNRKALEADLKKLKKLDEAKLHAKQKYQNYIDFIEKVDLNEIDNALLKKVINKIEAYTLIDDSGKQIKDIYIDWNLLDKSYDDMFYKGAKG